MESWQNPFGASCQNSSVKQKTLNCHEDFLDDDDSGDQVIYNYNHLESLRNLYQRGKQDTTQFATSNNVKGLGQRHSMIGSSLPSKQEAKVWTSFQVQPSEQGTKALSSLEKLHAFSFGGIHSDHLGTQSQNCLLSQTQAENSFTDFFVTENSLHKNNSQQFQSGSGPGPSHLGKRQHHESEELEAGVEEAGTWSRILKEAEKLDDNCHETTNSTACAPQPEKARLLRGNSTKHRFKFSIRRAKLPFYGKNDSNQHQDSSTDMSLAKRFDALAKCDVSAKDCRQLPMVERLEGLFENNISSPCSSHELRGIHKRKEARLRTSGKRVLPSPSGRYNVANEDILDSFDYEESSRDYENSGLGANMSSSKGREQMMTDLFQEALNAAPVAENSACFISSHKGTIYGFSNRLQNVLEHEKHQRMQFMKILHSGEKSHDEIKCIDVRILAKSFEAKLMICKCTTEKALESTQSIQHTSSVMETKRGDIITVIFSSRTSGHLEIEVGNLVRIHRPWVVVMELSLGTIMKSGTKFHRIRNVFCQLTILVVVAGLHSQRSGDRGLNKGNSLSLPWQFSHPDEPNNDANKDKTNDKWKTSTQGDVFAHWQWLGFLHFSHLHLLLS